MKIIFSSTAYHNCYFFELYFDDHVNLLGMQKKTLKKQQRRNQNNIIGYDKKYIEYSFRVYCIFLVCDNTKKLVFCIQCQNQVSDPNGPHTIPNAEVVSFNLISGRSDMVYLVKGYNCSKFGVRGGEGLDCKFFLVVEFVFCYVAPTDKVFNLSINL